MEKKNVIGYFAQPIEKLSEALTCKEIVEKNLIIDNYSTCDVIFKKIQYKQKDGSLSSPRFNLILNLHPAVEFELKNKNLINQKEFTLVQLALGIPFDRNELKFKGYIRFLKGESDSELIRSEDKSFLICELFIHPDLSPINSFVDNGTKLLMERIYALTIDQLSKLKCESLKRYPLFKISKRQADDVISEVSSED